MGGEQRQIQVQNQQREIKLQNQQREIQARNQQRLIQEQRLKSELLNQQNFQQSSFGSAQPNFQVDSKFKPVKNTFVHHEIQNQRKVQHQATNVLESQHTIKNEIPDVRRIKGNEKDFLSGKSDSLGSSPVNAGQSSTIFGISPSNRQSSSQIGSNLRGFRNRKTGNFVSSGRIGKSNSFESTPNIQEQLQTVQQPQTVAQLPRTGNAISFHPHTFFGASTSNRQAPVRLSPVQEHLAERDQVAQQVREGKAEAPSSFRQPGTIFGVTPTNRKSSSNFGSGIRSSGFKTGNFFSSGRIGKANSLEKQAQAQVPPLVLRSSIKSPAQEQIHNHQLNQQEQGVQNTQRAIQTVQPFVAFNSNRRFNTNIQTEVPIQTLPNIRPEVREELGQTQSLRNVQPSSQVFGRGTQNVQRFPQSIQNFRDLSQETLRPIQNIRQTSQTFGRGSQNVQRFPQPIKTTQGVTQENIEPTGQGFQRGSQNIRRFPQPIQINSGSSPLNVRPIQNVRLGSSNQPSQQFHQQSFFEPQILDTNEV